MTFFWPLISGMERSLCDPLIYVILFSIKVAACRTFFIGILARTDGTTGQVPGTDPLNNNSVLFALSYLG